MVSRTAIGRLFRVLGPALAFAMGLISAVPAYADFASRCAGCHAITGARRNAADAPAVITAANTSHGMGVGAFSGEFPAIATEIGNTFSLAQSTTVGYRTSGNVVTIANLFIDNPGAVITTTAVGTSPGAGTLSGVGTAGSFNVSYAHTGTNCTADSFGVHGTGLANTADRVVTVNITPPTVGASDVTVGALAYSTGAQSINIAGSITVSGNGSLPTGTLALSGQSGAGTTNATGATTLTYAATGTTYSSSVTVNYQATGPCSTTSPLRTITIPVNLPPAPTANDVSVALPSANGTMSTINMAGQYAGFTAASPLNILTQPPAGQGTVTVTSPTQFTYTASGFNGVTSFTYNVLGPTGSGLTSITRTVTITATAAPVASDTAVTTAFNTPITVDLTPFIAGAFTSVSVSGAPSNGGAIVAGPSSITFTPTGGFFGTGSFQFVANGPGGSSPSPGTVTVTVNPPPPTVSNITANVNFQTPTIVDVAPGINAVPVTSVNAFAPVNGTITGVVGTQVTFVPNAGVIGPASFQFTATNAGGTSAPPATANLTVLAPPPPTAGPVDVLVSSTLPTTIDLSAVITGFSSSVQLVTAPTAGTATPNGPTSFLYTPFTSSGTTDTFTYRAVGPGGNSLPATVRITYTNAPVTPNRTFLVPFNTITTLDLMAMVAGNVTSLNILSNPTNGIVLVRGNVVTYTPNPNYIGPDSFTYSASGPGGTSVPGVVSITVVPPIASPQDGSVSVAFNTPTPINLASFTSGVSTGFVITRAPEHGTVVIAGLIATYTPAPGYFGGDSFQYAAVNGAGTSPSATITISVGSVRPVAGSTTMTVPLNTSGSKDLAPFIAGSGVQGVSIPKQAAHGTVTVNGTVVTYTPKRDFFGTDSFQYLAFGNLGASDTPGVVTVTVVGRPDPSLDPNVRGLVDAQVTTTGRFARAQTSNIQRRMETLHRGPDSAFPEAPPKAPRAPAGEGGGSPQTPPAVAPTSRANPASPGSAPPALAAQGATGLSASPLVSSLISLAASQSVSLNGASTMRDGTSVWMSGLAQFGDIEGNGERSGLRFSTDGLTVGADRRLNDRLAVGIAAGYARDETRIGSDGSKSKARGGSFGVYSSYQPTPNTYIDGLLGFGKIEFDSTRFVEPFDAFATGRRKADQFFGSVAAGYEWRRDGILVSPYGRLDFTQDKLKEVTESGADQYNLTYGDQTARSTQLGVGIRAEAQHEMEFGRVVPRARLEYRREFQNDRNAPIRYADLLGGPEYSVSATGVSRNALLFGVGTEFLLNSGLKLGIDYTAERASGSKNVQTYRLFVSQDLDFKGQSPFRFGTDMLENPISVDFGFAHDDNVSRGRLSEEKRQDNITSLGIGQEWIRPLGTNLRLVATPQITAEKFRRFAGLGRFSGGIQGELQYRGSAAFDATTFGLRGVAIWDQYESKLRTGSRYFLGVNARRSFTDRIDVFGEVGGNLRDGRSEVFQVRDYSAKANIDYSLGRNGTLYFSGEYRRGDTFASGLGSLTNLALSDVFVADDAFESEGFFAYRIDASGVLGTFGYNRPLGPRDSLDFSWRRVQITPSNKPGFESGSLRYIGNQYSIVYLLRF